MAWMKSVLPRRPAVAELNRGEIREYTITPEQFGIERQSLDGLKVENAEQSLALIKNVLSGRHDDAASAAASDMVALNAGAAIYAANIASDLQQGVSIAQDVLATGLAGEKLKELAQITVAMKDAE